LLCSRTNRTAIAPIKRNVTWPCDVCYVQFSVRFPASSCNSFSLNNRQSAADFAFLSPFRHSWHISVWNVLSRGLQRVSFNNNYYEIRLSTSPVSPLCWRCLFTAADLCRVANSISLRNLTASRCRSLKDDSQPSLYEDSHYEISLIHSAWLVIRTRTRSSEIFRAKSNTC
jgi:hypothetical protein